MEDLLEAKSLGEAERSAIDNIKELMANCSNIKFQEDQYFLTKYLRASNWCAETAFERIRRVYKLKRDHPSCYAAEPLAEYEHLFKYEARIIQKELDINGRTVLICKYGKMMPPCTYDQANVLDDIWFDMILSRPSVQINGITIIADCFGVNAAVLKWFTIRNMKYSGARMGLTPVRNWTVHVINMGPIISTCISLIKPFLKREVNERFVFHDKSFEKLHELVGKKCLPREYGGCCDSEVDIAYSRAFLQKRRIWFDMNIAQNYGYAAKTK